MDDIEKLLLKLFLFGAGIFITLIVIVRFVQGEQADTSHLIALISAIALLIYAYSIKI